MVTTFDNVVSIGYVAMVSLRGTIDYSAVISTSTPGSGHRCDPFELFCLVMLRNLHIKVLVARPHLKRRDAACHHAA